MRVLVTGASGWIGSAVTPALLAAGHDVLGLARSDASARAIEALGAEPVRGTLDDADSVGAAATKADGVVHLAYHHDFSQMAEAAAMDRAAIDAIGTALTGTGGPFVVASGTLGLAVGRLGTEADAPDPATHPRVANGQHALDYAASDVRTIATRFAPTVHGGGDLGFIATIAKVARDRGFSAYIDDGANRWPAVNRADAAALVARAVDDAPARSVLHAVAEQGITTREIAEAIGRTLGLPVRSVARAGAAEHFGWIGMFFGLDCPVSNDVTRELLQWEPNHQGLIADIEAGYYPGTDAHS